MIENESTLHCCVSIDGSYFCHFWDHFLSLTLNVNILLWECTKPPTHAELVWKKKKKAPQSFVWWRLCPADRQIQCDSPFWAPLTQQCFQVNKMLVLFWVSVNTRTAFVVLEEGTSCSQLLSLTVVPSTILLCWEKVLYAGTYFSSSQNHTAN